MSMRNGYRRWVKKRAHRAVRRSELCFQKGNHSNKLYDYKWEIW